MPIFEIRTKDNHYKIYENGTIEGFPLDSYIINRIQIVLATRLAKFLEEQKVK